MIQNCPVCGKAFDVLWPHLWAYKKGSQFICSWSCLRISEKGVEHMSGVQKVPDEAKQAAIEAAISGGDPYEELRPYTSNPKAMWTYMKQQLKKKDPDLYKKIPDLRNRKKPEPTLADAMEGMQSAADDFFGLCEDMGLKLGRKDKPATVTTVEEVPKITKPVVYDDMTVREVEGGFGRYRRSDVNDKTYIDFEYTEGADTISLTVEQWRKFRKEQARAAVILGVEI